MSGLRDLKNQSVADIWTKVTRIHFRTSTPASPNLSAAYPIAGSAAMVKGGVNNLHFRGTLALKTSMVATTA